MSDAKHEHHAVANLRTNQRQLDADGCEVGVSRQALDETLSLVDVLMAALICLIPQTFSGDFKRSAEIAHWERERDLGDEYAPSVLAAFAAIDIATGAANG
jgi:hypothetical protein